VQRPRFIDPFQPAEVRRLVREFGSPLLILDCERARVQYRKLRRALPGVQLYYALKPLPHAAMVQAVIGEGGNLDLATTGEVQLVQRLGVDPARCIHTHPIKRPEDIANALKFGVRTFVADNPDEVRKFVPYRDQAELLLRVSFRSPGAVCDLLKRVPPRMSWAQFRVGYALLSHPLRQLSPNIARPAPTGVHWIAACTVRCLIVVK
jgi:ornithine decarboxylase